MRPFRLFPKSGFSLPEVTISIFILGVIGLMMMTQVDQLNLAHAQNLRATGLNRLREEILSQILSQEAWDQTRSANALIFCHERLGNSCQGSPGETQGMRERNPANASAEYRPGALSINSGRPFRLLNSRGQLVVDSANLSAGFDELGKPCNAYSPEGSDLCPIRAEAFIRFLCPSGANCKFPQESVSVVFSYSPRSPSSEIINISRYNIRSLNRTNFSFDSPVAICALNNQIYIGEGNSVLGGNGQVSQADAEGCVDRQAFIGSIGPQGDPGPQGPQGPPGPPGAINASATPPAAVVGPQSGDIMGTASCSPYTCPLSGQFGCGSDDPANPYSAQATSGVCPFTWTYTGAAQSTTFTGAYCRDGWIAINVTFLPDGRPIGFNCIVP